MIGSVTDIRMQLDTAVQEQGQVRELANTEFTAPQGAGKSLREALWTRPAPPSGGLTESQFADLRSLAKALNEITAKEHTLAMMRFILAKHNIDVDVKSVTDLQSTTGQKLNGFASGSTILLDADLNGIDLRNTLVEELAESFHQVTMGRFSKGDFGAEVVARMNGEVVGEGNLNTYTYEKQTDTVMVVGADGQTLIGEASYPEMS